MFVRILAWWKDYRAKKKDIVVVAKFETAWQQDNDEEVLFETHYVLYENGLGKRTVDIGHTTTKKVPPSVHVRDEKYITTVLPWLKGVAVNEIDTFEQAKQKLFMNKLTK